MNALVADAADDRPRFHLEDDNLCFCTLGRVLDSQLYILKKLRVPQSMEVAAQGLLVERIPLAAKDACLQGVGPQAAVSQEFDAHNNLLPLVE